MDKSILGWHFVADSGLLRDGQKLERKLYTFDGPLVLCKSGLHASRRAIDALQYAPGVIVCRVRSSGRIVESNDKYISSAREVLQFTDASRVLHEFACECAEVALMSAGIDDERCWNAIHIKREWLEGRATDRDLAEARDAAREEAWDAAREAAWDAAWGAAREAAWGAAWGAAREAFISEANARLEEMLTELLEESTNT